MKIGPKFKIGKRLGASVYEKCQTQKFALSEGRSNTSPKRRSARSDYGKQFLEKQKVRFTYGITERQFKNYVRKANESHSGNPSLELFRLLETRIDNVVYRMGLAKTRRAARQFVSHGHILLNGVKTTIPSAKVVSGDIVAIRGGSKATALFSNLSEQLKEHTSPSWVSFDDQKGQGMVAQMPNYNKNELPFDLSPVLEFYSR